MVAHSRTPPRPGSLRALNQPQPVRVETGDGDIPSAVWNKRRRLPVEALDAWRIDDEWWRERPVSRLYYRVTLEDGGTAVLFRDLVDGAWYRQRGT